MRGILPQSPKMYLKFWSKSPIQIFVKGAGGPFKMNWEGDETNPLSFTFKRTSQVSEARGFLVVWHQQRAELSFFGSRSGAKGKNLFSTVEWMPVVPFLVLLCNMKTAKLIWRVILATAAFTLISLAAARPHYFLFVFLWEPQWQRAATASWASRRKRAGKCIPRPTCKMK